MRLGNTVEFTHVPLGLVPEILHAIDVIVGNRPIATAAYAA
jgi:hypothetical protein